MLHRFRNVFIATAWVLAGTAPSAAVSRAELPTLTAGEQVHQLSREEARRKYPAVIQA